MALEPRLPVGTVAAMAAAVMLLAGALAVRAVRGDAPLAPADRPHEENALREPMQFLGRGSRLRLTEISERISEPNRDAWRMCHRSPFDLEGCPRTADWLATPAGQRLERLLGDLRRGTREEALAALALVFELARRTEWDPGLMMRSQHAERLATLLSDWLRVWSERACADATLSEPALAAALLYGRAMRIASERPIGRDADIEERAVAFLARMLSDGQGQPTALARALEIRHPTALTGFASRSDRLAGFDGAAKQLFPELTGECE